MSVDMDISEIAIDNLLTFNPGSYKLVLIKFYRFRQFAAFIACLQKSFIPAVRLGASGFGL